MRPGTGSRRSRAPRSGPRPPGLLLRFVCGRATTVAQRRKRLQSCVSVAEVGGRAGRGERAVERAEQQPEDLPAVDLALRDPLVADAVDEPQPAADSGAPGGRSGVLAAGVWALSPARIRSAASSRTRSTISRTSGSLAAPSTSFA